MAGGLPHPVLIPDLVASAVGVDLGKMAVENPKFLAYGHLLFFTWMAMTFLLLVSLAVRWKLSSATPGKLQNVLELIIGGLEDFVVSNIGKAGRTVFPLLCTLFLYILVCNLMGLMPGCDAPTANINTNVGMAILVFVVYNYLAFKTKGPRNYGKEFLGPIKILAPLICAVEILSHLSRPLSLTLRLFGNIRGEEIVLTVLFLLAPLFGTLPMSFLFLGIKVIQAFVFFMMAMVYFKMAVEESH